MQTLSQIQRQGYITDDAPATVQDAYRLHCQKKQLPTVTVARNGRYYLVVLDMATTGHGLNVVGTQVLAQFAWRLGSVENTANGIRAYSASTAQTLAKRLANIGKDKRFWSR